MCLPQVVHPNSIFLFLNVLYIWHYPVFLIFLKSEWWFFFFLIRLPEVDLGIYFIYFQYYVMGVSGGCWGEGLNTISYNDLFLLFISILFLFLCPSFAFTSSP